MTNKTRTEETDLLANKFNTLAKKENSMVRLRVNDKDCGRGSFEFYYAVRDPFIRKDLHKEGCAIIYISDTAKAIVEGYALGIGKTIGWNNTETRGWFQ